MRVAYWLDAGSKRDRNTFRAVAESSEPDTIEPVTSGRDLLRAICRCPPDTIDHVVIAGHGGTTWLLDSRRGVTTGDSSHPDQIRVFELAEEFGWSMRDGALISIAACLCSRSPTWWLRQRWGRHIGSDWGRRAYLPGGEASFSARLRDYLWWHGRSCRVRGHRAAGHASSLALLAEHRGGVDHPAGSQCDTLFDRTLPGVEPSLLVRRWWVKNVTGSLARRWLFGDDGSVLDIRSLYRQCG